MSARLSVRPDLTFEFENIIDDVNEMIKDGARVTGVKPVSEPKPQSYKKCRLSDEIITLRFAPRHPCTYRQKYCNPSGSRDTRKENTFDASKAALNESHRELRFLP